MGQNVIFYYVLLSMMLSTDLANAMAYYPQISTRAYSKHAGPRSILRLRCKHGEVVPIAFQTGFSEQEVGAHGSHGAKFPTSRLRGSSCSYKRPWFSEGRGIYAAKHKILTAF